MLKAIGLTTTLFHLMLWFTHAFCGTSQHVEDWINPRTSSVFIVGKSITIQWTSDLWTWISKEALQIDASYADLWACGYSSGANCLYQHSVASSVNISQVYSASWNVLIPDLELYNVSNWILLFVPDGETPLETSTRMFSPPFLIHKDTLTSDSVTSSAQSTISSMARATTTVMPPSTTTTDVLYTIDMSSAPSPSTVPPVLAGLTKGVIGAIAGGSVSGAIGLIALGWALARCRKSRSDKEMDQQETTPIDNSVGNTCLHNALTSEEKTMENSSIVHELVGSSAKQPQIRQSQYWNSPAELSG